MAKSKFPLPLALGAVGLGVLLMTRKSSAATEPPVTSAPPPSAPPPTPSAPAPKPPRQTTSPRPAAPAPEPADDSQQVFQLKAGQQYIIKQFVQDIPDDDEAAAVRQSLNNRGHHVISMSPIAADSHDWVVKYQTFVMPNDAQITRGQNSHFGPYLTSVMDIQPASGAVS